MLQQAQLCVDLTERNTKCAFDTDMIVFYVRIFSPYVLTYDYHFSSSKITLIITGIDCKMMRFKILRKSTFYHYTL